MGEETTNRTSIWYIKTFILLLLIPVRTFALYYIDILSDIAQTFSLFNNCHIDYGLISFAIIASSYFLLAVYTKFVENIKWFQSYLYPYTSGYVDSTLEMLCTTL